jgi:signal transduction histidine kinase
MDSAKRQQHSEEIQPSEIPVAWCKIDTNGEIINANQIFAAVLGGELREISGQLFQTFYENNGISLSKIFTALACGNSLSFRGWLRRKNTNKFPAIIHASSALGLSGKCEVSLVITDDSTEYYGRERARMENESSKQKDQLKNEFIAIASHELRTPIQPILGFALLAKRGKIGQEQAWDGVLKEARRLQQLANDILDVSRIESNTVSYKMERIRINDLIQSILDSAKTDLKKEILFELNTENPDQEIEADRSRLTQVITNLVGNSTKFTAKGMVTISTRLLPESGSIEIKVRDTGPGIPEEIFAKLFTKFATKDHGDALVNQGTGLGLFICKAIITAHRGTISARNALEGGAEFEIMLPVAQN